MEMSGGDMEAASFDNNALNTSQQPQLFGASNPDGSPVTTSLSGAVFMDESNDAKRRRIARACDMCRKKKIKCDGKMPKCSHCINYKSECIFTQVEKKRNPPKGAKYIEGLENRLGRMESLLRLSGLLSENDAGKTDLGVLEKRLADRAASPGSQQSQSQPQLQPQLQPQQSQPPKSSTVPKSYNAFMGSVASPSNSTPRGDFNTSPRTSPAAGTPDSHKESEAEVDSLSDMMCSLVTNSCGETRYIVEKQYSRDPYEGSGWWASINVALAIAHRLRVMSNLAPQEEDKKAWLYLKNAMGVLTELTMRNTDLLSVQALLGMALFLQGTPNPQPSFFLVAAGIRLSHSIGLHKRCSGFGLNPVELEQRKRVFWIAYILDKDICLRSGRPPVQDDDDMNVELPSEDPPDNIGNVPLSDGKGKINLFRLMCIFATIESKVYRQLYSTKSSRQSDGELLNTIGELDHELEEWKNSIPLDFRPEHEIKTTHRPLILPIVVLHFAYYNCLTTIHRMSVHHGYWTSRLSNYAIQGLNARPLNPRVFSSAVLCVSAARASINLIKYIPQGDFACVWLILYFPISSLVTLFANILQNPLDARARSDVKLMNLVVNFLSMLATDESNGSVKRMLSVCSEFERIAKVALDRAEKESQSRRKRKTSDEQPDSNTTPQESETDARRPRPPAMAPNPPVTNTQQHSFSSPFTTHLNHNISSTSSSTFPSPQTSSQNTFDTAANEDITAAQLKNTARFNQELNEIIGGPGLSVNPGLFNVDQQLPNEPMPLDVSSFQQPFVPQDLWQMPMTLEWDWADMSNGFPFSNGATE
ncbi:C6 transcription factor [Arthroderma uncinatum]|uniref:C6 transcription factor n=1 Tax=Arthroderma uncinatum TaxID=74035 RepID=UPI00144A73FF|nr:C6 transcription factor [Arthroderma uncinatum]KAF3490488.1 C6 transcription factor [Arthroderma uncinatum]